MSGQELEISVRQDDVASLLTFLIADIRGYTTFTLQRGDAAAARLAAQFAQTVTNVTEPYGGRVIELRGDEALVVFTSARQALRAAVNLQAACAAQVTEDTPLRIGIGLDAGEALPALGGYRGASLNLAARLCSIAQPGEILASTTVSGLARRLEGVQYIDRAAVVLKGFTDPVALVAVQPAGSQPPNATEAGEVKISSRSLPTGGFLGALPDTPLVAREMERRQIQQAIHSAEQGDGRLLLLTGEAGVGKTRLAQELTELAREAGFCVITGRCYEPYHAVPFYPFREAMAAAYSAASDGVRQQTRKEWTYIGRLLPDASLPAPPLAGNSYEEQQRLFWAVTCFIQAVSATAPVALLLDDLHWADISSLELLQHLARVTRGDRVLLVGTFRDTEIVIDRAMQRLFLDMEREQLIQRIAVRHLSERNTAMLVSATVGNAEVAPEVAQLVYGRSEGNPFFTREIMRALVERGEIYQENGRWAGRPGIDVELPPTLRTVVNERLGSLDESTQAVVQAASVLGQTFLFDDLEIMLGLPEEAIERSLDGATVAGLVRAGQGDEYTFSHALTQHALYADLPPRRKRRLHLAAGEAIERLSAGTRERRAAELARHFAAGGSAERGLPYAVMAGDAAEAIFAHTDAATHYRTALDLVIRIGDPAQEARVRERLGALLTATIQYGSALEMLDQAASLYGKIRDRESEGRVEAQVGRVHVFNGTPGIGLSRLDTYVSVTYDSAVDGVPASLMSARAHLLFALHRYPEALECATRAAHSAQVSRNSEVQIEAEFRRATSLAMLGLWDDARTSMDYVISLAERNRDVYTGCRARIGRAGIDLHAGNLSAARDILSAALAMAEYMGNRRQIAVSCYGLSLTAFVAEDENACSSHAERALAIMHTLEGSWPTATQFAGLDPATLPSADWSSAPHYLRECLEICRALS